MNRVAVAQELVKVAKDILATVKTTETSDELIVSGPYVEMKEIFPKLKGWGFRYNGQDRSWRIPLSKLTAEKRQKVEALISGKTTEQADRAKSIRDKLEDLVKRTKFQIFRVELSSDRLGVSGETYPIKERLYSLGGRWDGRGYVFSVAGLTETQVDELFDLLERKEKETVEALERRRDFFDKEIKGKSWAAGMISAELYDDALHVEVADRSMNNVVKNAFARAKWNGSRWEIPLAQTKLNEMKTFVELAEKENQKLSAPVPGAAPVKFSLGSGYLGHRHQPYAEGQVISRQGQYLKVLKVVGQYFSEDGLSFGVGDDQGYIWTVFARPATDQESEPVRQEQDKAKSRSEALTELKQIADDMRRRGNRPANADPHGDTIFLDKRNLLYGGGEWFVVGSSEIWFVKNNGGDGDDWSQNNVKTGGAGAIGWTIPYDPELANKIRTLAGKL